MDDDRAVRAVKSATPILLYDGMCGLCSSTVRFVLRHDRRKALRFAALHGRYGVQLVSSRADLKAVDSIVWVEPYRSGQGEQIWVRSGAALRLAQYLGGPWYLALLFYLVPRPLRDLGYELIARHRHLILREKQSSFVPSHTERSRFLD